jgi:hypothetical protein
MRWPLCIGVALHLLALSLLAGALVLHGRAQDDLVLFVSVFFLLGEAAFLDGVCEYVQSKGYNSYLGWLGLLGLLGLLAAWWLPYCESDASSPLPAGYDLILLGMDD